MLHFPPTAYSPFYAKRFVDGSRNFGWSGLQIKDILDFMATSAVVPSGPVIGRERKEETETGECQKMGARRET